MNPLRRGIFFDRDDTLIVNVPYCGDPAQVRVFAEAASALLRLQQAGFLLFIVSNQSGVGRGLITRAQVAAVADEMHRQLGQNFFAEVYNSYASPEDGPSDRKPSPDLLLRAARDFQLDLGHSVFIGDRLSDMQCGRRAGCATVLLQHAEASRDINPSEDPEAIELADAVAPDLTAAADWILQKFYAGTDSGN